MPKFVTRAAFEAAASYAGSLFLTHRAKLFDSLQGAGVLAAANRATITASRALTIDDGGLVLVDASAGDIVLTLPGSGATGDEIRYFFKRLDSTSYSVLVVRAGADTIELGTSLPVWQGSTAQVWLPAGWTDWKVFGLTNTPVVTSINGGQLAGHRNKIINPFTENQRGAASVADDVYCADRWYVLTESGNVTVAQIDDPESGAPKAWRMTQPDAIAKRIGLATIIEAKNIKAFRSAAMNFFMRVKPSFAGNVRYAILEHTGTADVVTSDVVNNWASAVFTAGNFFIGGLNVIRTGTVAPGAATYSEINAFGVLGAALNNVILFVWSEAAIAQNATLELNRPQFEPGMVHTPHEWRLNELALCQRYYEVGRLLGLGYYQTVTGNALDAFQATYVYKEQKRATPTVGLTNNGTGSAATTLNTVNELVVQRTGSMNNAGMLDVSFTSAVEI